MKLSVYICIASLLCYHYGQTEPAKQPLQKEIPVLQSAFNQLSLDSSAVEFFINQSNLSDSTAAKLLTFYANRNYQYAWLSEKGLSEQAQYFWNLHNQYLKLTKDSSIFDKRLHNTVEELLAGENELPNNRYSQAQLELQLTSHFLTYLKYAYTARLDPRDLQWHIPMKKIAAVSLLDSLFAATEEGLNQWEPVNRQYRLLKETLHQLYNLQKSGTWTEIQPQDKTVFHKGDTAAVIRAIKKRLHLMGDLPFPDSTAVFDNATMRAVKRMQQRFGLTRDGIIGPQVLRALNVPLEKRIQQLLINLERMRWLPQWPGGKRIVVNIPEYKVHVYEGAKEVLNMNIVVGKAATKTVIFSGELKYIVFSPYWNIPASIVRNEVLPELRRNANYLVQHNMEIYGKSNGMPLVRQKPGIANALGNVKFLFPNKYNIYLHDTPAKSLFENNTRAFSHGCIRLNKPFDLAMYLLKDNPVWTNEKVRSAMHRQTEKWVTLQKPVPVFIVYLTAWVDARGRLNFREDIYGHDQRMMEQLFENG
jgi:L,D-transpeptidase YcbB